MLYPPRVRSLPCPPIEYCTILVRTARFVRSLLAVLPRKFSLTVLRVPNSLSHHDLLYVL